MDGVIRDLDGAIFTPIGANVGTHKTFDWKGDARGHSRDALDWGWNTIRLNVMVTAAAKWSYVEVYGENSLLDLVAEVVDEYTAAGLVVIIDAHDNPRGKGYDQQAVEAGMIAWWKSAAARFRDNPRVWCGLINEPSYINDEWLRIIDSLATAVRDTGNANPILVAAPCWGQDVGYNRPYFSDAKFSYEPDMAPVLSRRYDNLILEQHNYGAYAMYSDAEKLAGYLAKVRDVGLTPLIGEFGYTIDRSSSAGDFASNYAGAQAVFDVARQLDVGAMWWHATHGDNYSLKANGEAFWNGGAASGLSDGGTKLWALAH
ncbi:glycoside hydrolase family 5 protein [Micropruina sp.]|uniref:glycoside hydrolase family 5 protein n=1 Tax=Micropruina sp. TaxID=2737536 RepID=UPI0039E5B2A9